MSPTTRAALAELPEAPAAGWNVLLITADDIGWDTLGCYGCPTPEATPSLDRFAADALRFERAHVAQAVCVPSRTSMQTGRYPHRYYGGIDSSGEPGYGVQPGVPTLPERLKAAGYFTAMLGKVTHHAPPEKFPWDVAINHWDWENLRYARDPETLGRRAGEIIGQATAAGKPFYLVVNSADPHRPFPGTEKPAADGKGGPFPDPSRVYQPDEIALPGFLPDLPEVRREYAQYLSGVRRADDSVGATLQALRDSGEEQNTLVLFLSDHGCPFPFAKENCYLASTKTPLMVRWPGVTRPGGVDHEHFVSAVDLAATLLEVCGLPGLADSDGSSFAPLLQGRKQPGRDQVVTVFHHTPGHPDMPMRGLLRGRYGYVYNAWAGGERSYTPGDPFGGLTWKAMREAAKSDPLVESASGSAWQRTPEELYDYEADPNALKNRIDDPELAEVAQRMRAELAAWMRRKKDRCCPGMNRCQAAANGDQTAVEGTVVTMTTTPLGADAADRGSALPRLNLLLITTDDLNFDSMGCMGCPLGATPNLDAFAATSYCFSHTHAAAPICQPSRSAFFTGRVPHRNSATGFNDITLMCPPCRKCWGRTAILRRASTNSAT